MDGKGLSSAEVKERIGRGLVNDKEERESRGYFEILAKNLLTPYNIVLFILGLALLYFGEPLSAIAATGIIIFNVIISTAQEWKAKRRLDKIAVLMRPKVSVLRDGGLKIIDRAEIVMDDIIHMGPGDQAQVDGVVIEEKSLEMDESLLSGESSTRRKHLGDKVYSGAYCVTGECWMKVTEIGDDTYSAQMMKKARKFNKKKTPLQTETNTVTMMLMGIAFVFLVILVVLNTFAHKNITSYLKEAVIVLDIVPIALFLLITLTYMVAAVRMADSGVLLQNSNSVESMSHVDTVCMDKTGTITTNNLVFERMECFGNDPETTETLIRAFVSATGSKNKTIVALTEKFGTTDTELIDEVQFSSERKFSAVRVRTEGEVHTIVMGAWPFLKHKVAENTDVEPILKDLSSKGLRSVVLFDADSAELHDGEDIIIPDLHVLAVISIRDEIRPDCKEIIDEFIDNGMDIKVISGDDPETVEAIFRLAEIPGQRKIVSGEQMENMNEEEFAETALNTNIFGRMKPEQKEKVIDSLRKNDRYVAMIGDGVNDVRSIKKAQVGVAVQSGSGAARGVADMVLMNDNFKAIPKAIVEGKRTVSGMRDILRLYLVRNAVLAILVLVLLLIIRKPPLSPIQNSAYAIIAVSISAFLLTLWAKPTENKELILPNVIRFVVPSALTISVFALAIYAIVFTGTENGWIDLTHSYEIICEKLNITMPELLKMLNFDGKPDLNFAEINARNAMLTFLLFAGVLQLFILFPPVKKLNIDHDKPRDFKPTVLCALLLGLVVLFYSVPGACVKLGECIPLFEIWPEILLGVAAWYAVTILLLKTKLLEPLTATVDKRIRENLEKSFGKEYAKELEEEE